MKRPDSCQDRGGTTQAEGAFACPRGKSVVTRAPRAGLVNVVQCVCFFNAQRLQLLCCSVGSCCVVVVLLVLVVVVVVNVVVL